MNKALVATYTGLAAVALVVGGSVTAVANGWNPLNVHQVVAEGVVTSADDPGTSTLDRGAAIASAKADKDARDAAAAALAAQQAADAAAAAQAAVDAQAAADAQARQTAPETQSVDAPAAATTNGPDLCPSGTQAQSSDGYNDTSCFPTICVNIPVPDPTHPECDYAYPPQHYR